MANPPAAVQEPVESSSGNLLARSLAWNIFGRGAGLVMSFLSSVALARVLGPADRGLFGLMISASTIALAVTAVGQPLAVTYFASRREVDGRGILGNTIAQGVLLAVVLVPATYLFYHPLADAFGHGSGGVIWVLAAALVPITFLDWMISNQLLGMLEFARYNGLKLVAGAAYTVAVLVLLGVLNLGLTGGLVATAIGSIVTAIGALPPILKAGRPRIDRVLLRSMLHYGSRVQAGVIFQMVNYRLDVIIMQFFRPLRQVGYYVAAQTIAELSTTLAVAFQSSLLPLASHYEGDTQQAATSASGIRHHGILAAVAGLVNTVFGSAVIYFAYGSAFRPAIVPMLVLLPGVWFLGLGLVIQADLGGRGHPGLSSKMAGLATIVTIVLDLALIPPLGVMGGALASVVAYTTFGVASLIALSRVSGIPMRTLVMPTRADFKLYAGFARRAVSAVARSGGRSA